jgi:hypothetical protein
VLQEIGRLKEADAESATGNARSFFCVLLAVGFVCFVAFLAGCGSGQQGPPVGDFSVSLSPDSTSAVVGNTTSSVLISTSPQNGFTGTINISLQGIPAGVNAMPAASFSLEAGASQSVRPRGTAGVLRWQRAL